MDLTAEIFVKKRIQYYHVYDTVYTEIHIFILFFGTNLRRDGIVLEFETNLWGDGNVFLNLRYEMDEIVIINNLLFNKALKTKG